MFFRQITRFIFFIFWRSDDPDDSDDEDQMKKAKSKLNDPNASKKKKSGSVGDDLGAEDDDDYTKPTQYGLDIMAQQFKFIACLKIMMEELSTLVFPHFFREINFFSPCNYN